MRTVEGLTLVELLVSLVIAALLVAAALGATASLTRSELAGRRDDARPERLQAALEMSMGTDLLHAHHYRDAPQGFSLQAHVRLAAGTLKVEHVPAAVTYQVRKAGDRTYLVRLQESAGEKPATELVAEGVRSVRFVPTKQTNPNPDGWRPIAGPCAARLEFDSGVIEVRNLERSAN